MSLKIKLSDEAYNQFWESTLDTLADFIFSKSQEIIVDKAIIDEGTLLKSGNINRETLTRKIIYPVLWADTIEYGRLPGTMPPVQMIQNWVERKLGVKNKQESNKIAWAISMDIKKNGMNPRPYLRPAMEQAENEKFRI